MKKVKCDRRAEKALFGNLLEDYRQACLEASWLWHDYNNRGITVLQSRYEEAHKRELDLREKILAWGP